MEPAYLVASCISLLSCRVSFEATAGLADEALGSLAQRCLVQSAACAPFLSTSMNVPYHSKGPSDKPSCKHHCKDGQDVHFVDFSFLSGSNRHVALFYPSCVRHPAHIKFFKLHSTGRTSLFVPSVHHVIDASGVAKLFRIHGGF